VVSAVFFVSKILFVCNYLPNILVELTSNLRVTIELSLFTLSFLSDLSCSARWKFDPDFYGLGDYVISIRMPKSVQK